MRSDRIFRGYGLPTLVLPFVVYLGGMAAAGWLGGLYYPESYSLVVGATLLLMLGLRRGYSLAPFSVSRLSLVVGVLGVFLWIGLWWIERELVGLASLFGSAREAFNPFEQLKGQSTWMWSFLTIRFLGLVVVVPVIEEFFLRGFLMRYLIAADWDRVPLGKTTWLSAVGVAVYGVVSHPAEPLSAVVWFSMVTWLYARTGSVWDCVVAHAITNLLLGLYIVGTGTWELW